MIHRVDTHSNHATLIGRHSTTVVAIGVIAISAILAAETATGPRARLEPLAALASVALAAVFMGLIAATNRPRRLQPLLFAGAAVALSLVLAFQIIDGGQGLRLVAALLLFALALLVLTAHVQATFAGWLFLAPFFQIAAR